MVVHAPEGIPIGHGRERTIERKNFEAVARKLKLANDFRAKQRDDVRTFRKKEPGEDFFGNGSASKDMAAFEGKHLFPCLSKVSGVHETVVAAADDHDVVVLRHPELLR